MPQVTEATGPQVLNSIFIRQFDQKLEFQPYQFKLQECRKGLLP